MKAKRSPRPTEPVGPRASRANPRGPEGASAGEGAKRQTREAQDFKETKIKGAGNGKHTRIATAEHASPPASLTMSCIQQAPHAKEGLTQQINRTMPPHNHNNVQGTGNTHAWQQPNMHAHLPHSRCPASSRLRMRKKALHNRSTEQCRLTITTMSRERETHTHGNSRTCMPTCLTHDVLPQAGSTSMRRPYTSEQQNNAASRSLQSTKSVEAHGQRITPDTTLREHPTVRSSAHPNSRSHKNITKSRTIPKERTTALPRPNTSNHSSTEMVCLSGGSPARASARSSSAPTAA
mmetsp:Transcript_21706/g.57925  ORF Transcript_21706/g.57925 Transcript_21706/m.57925 type:complete len:293 (+) Transcript_21706:115-993(+)